MTCAHVLHNEGHGYPSTCADCGLGPCQAPDLAQRDHRSAIAMARDVFMASPEGERLQSGVTSGPYLRNRLEAAFLAGYNAKEKELA